MFSTAAIKSSSSESLCSSLLNSFSPVSCCMSSMLESSTLLFSSLSAASFIILRASSGLSPLPELFSSSKNFGNLSSSTSFSGEGHDPEPEEPTSWPEGSCSSGVRELIAFRADKRLPSEFVLILRFSVCLNGFISGACLFVIYLHNPDPDVVYFCPGCSAAPEVSPVTEEISSSSGLLLRIRNLSGRLAVTSLSSREEREDLASIFVAKTFVLCSVVSGAKKRRLCLISVSLSSCDLRTLWMKSSSISRSVSRFLLTRKSSLSIGRPKKQPCDKNSLFVVYCSH